MLPLTSPSLLLLAALLSGSLAPPAPAQTSRDQRTPFVGMRAYIDQLVLPGPRLEVAPRDPDAPLVLRIVRTFPHGTDTRYDFEYYGLEPGRYDLGELLQLPDGSRPGSLPAVTVEILPTLPPGIARPNELQVERSLPVGGYGRLLLLAGVVWLVGLVAILLLGRRRRAADAAAEERPRSLADRLRPLVERATHGELDQGGKAELERLLLNYWRERLGLEGVRASEAMRSLRADREAGALLQQLDAWLHRPQPPGTVELGALLAPYRDAPDPEHAP